MAYSNYKNLKVLVVDDFKQFHQTISAMLESFGVTNVDAVESGKQALSACKNRVYDLILCDYNLGQDKMNGQQILETFRHNHLLDNGTLFVLVTAEVSKPMVMATYDNVPDAYIIKPFNAKLLHQRLDRLLDRRDAMSEIDAAIEEGEKETAIQLCETQLRKGGRYRSDCMKLLGKLYLEEGLIERSEQVYNSVLETRDLDWAKVGLAEAKLAREDYDASIKLVQEVIKKNPVFMPAYDVLADNYRQKQDLDMLQFTLKMAADACPRAILRQQKLAKIAHQNNDIGTAAEAFAETIDLGTNSCHDSVDNYIGFGRSTAELLANKDPRGEDYRRKAQEALESAGTRFRFIADDHPQLQLALSQFHYSMRNVAEAEKHLHKAEKAIDNQSSPPTLEIAVDMAQTLSVCGHTKRSEELLKELLERYKNNEAALEKLDKLFDEPLSAAGRKRVAAINRDGVSLYEEKRYREAIEVFKRAQLLFPKYVGIRLNLAQALNGEVQRAGYDAELMTLCLNTLASVEPMISPEHEQYARFQQLYETARELNAQP